MTNDVAVDVGEVWAFVLLDWTIINVGFEVEQLVVLMLFDDVVVVLVNSCWLRRWRALTRWLLSNCGNARICSSRSNDPVTNFEWPLSLIIWLLQTTWLLLLLLLLLALAAAAAAAIAAIISLTPITVPLILERFNGNDSVLVNLAEFINNAVVGVVIEVDRIFPGDPLLTINTWLSGCDRFVPVWLLTLPTAAAVVVVGVVAPPVIDRRLKSLATNKNFEFDWLVVVVVAVDDNDNDEEFDVGVVRFNATDVLDVVVAVVVAGDDVDDDNNVDCFVLLLELPWIELIFGGNGLKSTTKKTRVSTKK